MNNNHPLLPLGGLVATFGYMARVNPRDSLGVTLQTSSVIKYGDFEVPVTPSYRDCFAGTHDEISGQLPSEQQFGFDEQIALFDLCMVYDDNDKVDIAETELIVIELQHYLSGFGLTGARVHPRIKLFSAMTTSLSMRLHAAAFRRNSSVEATVAAQQEREAKERTVLESLFLAPDLSKVAVA